MTTTMKTKKTDTNVLMYVIPPLLILAAMIFLLNQKTAITISREDVQLDPANPCKNILSIMQKSLFFVREQWLPKNESNLSCIVGKNFRGNHMEIRWGVDDINFHYIIVLNESEPCSTDLYFDGYPERKQPYPKNLSEQMQFFSKFYDLSYFCFDINRTNFFSNDFDGGTDLYSFEKIYDDVRTLTLSRNRYHRDPQAEQVYMYRYYPSNQSKCFDPMITGLPVRDYSKNETCLKTKGKLTGELYESNWVEYGRKYTSVLSR